jgi:hypothetical protein
MSENVDVTGTPQLTLNIGGAPVQANYASGSGTSELIFTYTIQAGDTDANGISIDANSLTLNGGTIKADVAGTNAIVTHAAVADNASYLVDTVAPTISSVAITSAPGSQNNTLGEGDWVMVTVTMSENTTVDTTGGTPQLTLNIGGTPVQASYVSGTGTNALEFMYIILPGQTDIDGISIDANSLTLNGGTIKDVAGTNATLTHTAVTDNATALVDTTAPTVSSVAITSATGIQNGLLNADDVVSVTVTMSEIIAVDTAGGTPQLALNIGGTTVQASYVSGSGTQALVFEYTIVAGQTDIDGISIDANSLTLNGAILADFAGYDATLTHTAVAYNESYMSAMVDTIVAAPTLALTTNSGITSDMITNVGTLQAPGGVEADAIVEYSLDGSTDWTTTQPTAVEGVNTVYVRQTDAAGNQSAPSAAFTYTLDTTAPSVTGAAVLSATDSLGAAKATTLVAGDHVLATVAMSEAVTVDPLLLPSYTLELDGGQIRVATYDAALSDATHLVFSYTVVAGDMDLTGGVTAAANALTAAAGAIVDVAGNAANVNVAAVASSAVVIDTMAPTVTNAAVLDGQADLEVTSDIVLNMGTAVSYAQGGLIQIVNDANSGSKLGYISSTTDFNTGVTTTPAMGETVAHSINLYLGSSTVTGGITTISAFQDAGLTTASGTVTIDGNGLVTLNPLYDLDLSNNYHVEIAAGTFTKTSNGLANVAFGAVDGSGNYAMNFSTVTPGEATTAGSLAASAASTKMDVSGGSLLAGHDWVSVDVAGLGGFFTLQTLDLSAKDYALTFRNASTAAGELGLANNVYIDMSGFNANDMLYFDDQNNAGAISFEGDANLNLQANASPFDNNGSLAYDMYMSSPALGAIAVVGFNGVNVAGSLADISMRVVVA